MEGQTTKGHVTFPVYYEDTDFSGFVYHTNYIKYFERAREHLIGVDYLKRLYEDNLHFVVRHIDITYFRPGKFGDVIHIDTEAEFSRSPIIPFTQIASLVEQDGTKTQLVKAEIKLVMIRGENPTRMPDFLIEHLQGQGV